MTDRRTRTGRVVDVLWGLYRRRWWFIGAFGAVTWTLYGLGVLPR